MTDRLIQSIAYDAAQAHALPMATRGRVAAPPDAVQKVIVTLLHGLAGQFGPQIDDGLEAARAALVRALGEGITDVMGEALNIIADALNPPAPPISPRAIDNEVS